jgi:hypothetical protein
MCSVSNFLLLLIACVDFRFRHFYNTHQNVSLIHELVSEFRRTSLEDCLFTSKFETNWLWHNLCFLHSQERVVWFSAIKEIYMETKLLAAFLIIIFSATIIRSQDLAMNFVENVSADLVASRISNSNEIPAGTVISVTFDSEVSSANAAVDDTFNTMLAEPLFVNGIAILPAKTIIRGRVSKVERAARGGKAGKLEIVFERIDLKDGEFRSIKGEPKLSNILSGKSSAAKNATLIGGGAGIGAAVGAGVGGGSKSLIGGLLGAGIGIGSVIFTKGNEAILKAKSKIEIEIKEKVILPTTDY